MTPNETASSVLKYAVGWHDAYWERILIGAVGALILFLVIRVLSRKEGSVLASVLWLIIGSILLLFASIPEQSIAFVVSKEYMIRIRFIMGVLSVFVLLITFESIRKTHLQERYALLWLTTALIILLCIIFPDTVALFRAVTGMNYVASVVAVAFTFLFLVAFRFSVSLSDIQSKQSKLSQRIAILEARIKSFEAKQDKDNEKS